MIEAEAIEHGRLQIVNVDRVFDDVQAQIVGLARPPVPPLMPPPAIHML